MVLYSVPPCLLFSSHQKVLRVFPSHLSLIFPLLSISTTTVPARPILSPASTVSLSAYYPVLLQFILHMCLEWPFWTVNPLFKVFKFPLRKLTWYILFLVKRPCLAFSLISSEPWFSLCLGQFTLLFTLALLTWLSPLSLIIFSKKPSFMSQDWARYPLTPRSILYLFTPMVVLIAQLHKYLSLPLESKLLKARDSYLAHLCIPNT